MAKLKEQDKIPVTKVHRASKFVATGAKIGTNYLKHYGKKLINPSMTKEELHQDNANDIYQSLSQLKGSALKVAQMLSMDKNLLPTAYQQQFSMAQYSAPPLSFPLVVKTFEQHFKKKPSEIFDSFTSSAVNAASMGQVHQATFKGKKLAVKIQYPGVGDTIKSDLAMVKPIALRMFKINPTDYNEFIQEVQSRLSEEADYTLELQRSIELSEKSSAINNLIFPTYYPQWSSAKVLTMDWIDGEPLGEFLKTKSGTKQERQQIGQAMWDFYHYQIHTLKALHADPHPGNFIVTPNRKLGVIDFGCVKVIPSDFYKVYFQLFNQKILTDKQHQEKIFHALHFIYEDDTAQEKRFFTQIFERLVELLGRPFKNNSFDFSEKKYFEELFRFGQEISTMKEFRDSKKARGVKDALYINRTYYGLYNLLHELGAEVNTTRYSSISKD
jgi:predicted unusual protein kinase regulating ubiquinone biosynthesis (AarF/ABC1/UbiB family)